MTCCVALIPARGGSKRLPRKNIIDFLGRPIIEYTIEAAHRSGCFNRIVVSTEDQEIATLASEYGAEVAERSMALAGDSASVIEVCLDFLARQEASGKLPDHLAVLYPTAPLRSDNDVKAVMSKLEPGVCDFAMAVTRYDLPPHQALKFGPDDTLQPMWPELVARRSSDLPQLCVDNGSTYAVTTEAFREHRTFYGPTLRGFEMPRERSIDIDTPLDLELARAAARRLGLSRAAAIGEHT